MQYKYFYRFVMKGSNRDTLGEKILSVLEQRRNIGIDSQLYSLIRKEAFSNCEKYCNIRVAIYRVECDENLDYDNVYNEDLNYIGMLFFDKREGLTHRAVCINDNLGLNRYWGCFNCR